MTLAVPKQQATSIRTQLSTVAPEKPGAAEQPSHLAHDARNWLTVLQMYCDLLRTSGVVADKGQRWIEELSNAVERGYGLVDSLLERAQSSGPLHRFSAEEAASSAPLALAAAIERRLPLLRQMAGNSIQVEIKTVAHDGPTALKEPEFERILLNLARNAIEAMPRGGRLRVALEYRDSSERRSLVLRVSDTGSGIASELLPYIFDSGVSTKFISSDHSQSRGFGLAIVRELTLGAGGSVRVRSRLGHGTSFAIELPLLSDPLISAPRPRARKLGAVSEMPKQRRIAAPNAICDANRKGTRVPC